MKITGFPDTSGDLILDLKQRALDGDQRQGLDVVVVDSAGEPRGSFPVLFTFIDGGGHGETKRRITTPGAYGLVPDPADPERVRIDS